MLQGWVEARNAAASELQRTRGECSFGLGFCVRRGGYATVQQIVADGETLLFLYWLLYGGGGFVCWGFLGPRVIKG
jgi:hypothetical protein